jgi:inhibitor of KinA
MECGDVVECSVSFHPLGDTAVIVQLNEDSNRNYSQTKIQTIVTFLENSPPVWMNEYIPSFQTVAIFYDPLKVPFTGSSFHFPYDYVCNELRQMIAKLHINQSIGQQIIEIPICYGGDFGPDLSFVANFNGLSTDEVIRIHTSGDYLVYMIGFSPGFPYLGGMSDKIAAPRRETPRLNIPARSVGIAGNQTGIYPIETPGGWQIIGRTPVNLFRPNHKIPSLLRSGDRIKFKSISLKEYHELEEII